ncbi:MAG: bifunctional diaminohydroxyphosphoribosylaminopyrimidine deaminase/5-amino-6-(5-phosphoribosylamino)uracil reductase RibD [Chloroflexota bacterium]|nr:bifunctional diaminohydroxyphosphoribosylaminopyrimidine deaminase/5-amino-6-(5-phosphoribosylamino)uracil reductase RibD [Chloroflexota bacterium]
MDEINFQQRAIDLAKDSIGIVSPRPAVGAVIVSKGKIISEGKTQQSPLGHAEAEAIRKSKIDLSKSTLYCTLEPHNFISHDTPCTELIINSGIKKISCPKVDNNPKVKGNGFKELEKAGIEIIRSWGKDQMSQIDELYSAYDFKIINKRPRISAKFAMTLDGKISTSNKESKWITSEESRNKVHEIRNKSDAIISGINTIISDNSKLTARLNNKHTGKPEYRVVLDNNARLNNTLDIYKDQNSGKVIWFTSKNSKPTNIPNHITHINSKNERISPIEVIRFLSEIGCYEILLESGGTLLGSFFDEKLVDKVYAFIAPSIFGGASALSPVAGKGIQKITDKINLSNLSIERIKEDILITGIID